MRDGRLFLLNVGATVNKATFLMTLLERACQIQLLVGAAAANGVKKVFVSDSSARYTFENSGDAETLYWEGQPDLDFVEKKSKGEQCL